MYAVTTSDDPFDKQITLHPRTCAKGLLHGQACSERHVWTKALVPARRTAETGEEVRTAKRGNHRAMDLDGRRVVDVLHRRLGVAGHKAIHLRCTPAHAPSHPLPWMNLCTDGRHPSLRLLRAHMALAAERCTQASCSSRQQQVHKGACQRGHAAQPHSSADIVRHCCTVQHLGGSPVGSGCT